MLTCMNICICLQVAITKCTIDINVEEFSYMANHLTPQECRRLFASLHFTSYHLPAVLSAAENSLPQNVPCTKLLLKWNSDVEKWEGKDKTHVDIQHRLRQLGRSDLANWLGRTVFHELAKDVFNALDNSFTDEYEEISKKKLYEDKYIPVSDEWTDLDYILWFVLIGLVLTAGFTFGNIIALTFKKGTMKDKIDEEEMDLISRLSIDSDQDTVYNYECINTREENVKRSKEGID